MCGLFGVGVPLLDEVCDGGRDFGFFKARPGELFICFACNRSSKHGPCLLICIVLTVEDVDSFSYIWRIVLSVGIFF